MDRLGTMRGVSDEGTDSGVRSRTRRAILDAATAVWSKDPGASLGAVATEARVGRTTVHRYFRERDDLAAALGLDVVTRLDGAAQRARLDEGPAAEALRRLCQEYFELADVLALMFNGSGIVNDDTWTEAGCVASDLQEVVTRGHEDGSVDRALTPGWVESLLWALLYASWDLVRNGNAGKQQVIDMLTRSFEGAVSARSRTGLLLGEFDTRASI